MTGRVEKEGPIRVEHLETLRTARFCLLGGEARAPSEVWYVLHGYRQLAHRFIARFQTIAAPGRLIVAPEGASRFYLRSSGEGGHSDAVGASWMTREDREREIEDYVRCLDRVACTVEQEQPEGNGASRTVLGFSQGGATAARWAVLGTHRPHRLVLWGAGLPPNLSPDAAERLRGVDVCLVRGKQDRLRRAEDEAREEQWLKRARVGFSTIEHEGGHEIDDRLLAEIAARA